MSIANFNLYEILFQKTDWVYRYEKDSKNELALKNFCNFCNFCNKKTKMFILWCFFSVAEKNKNKRSATETTKYNICRLIHIVFLSCRSWTSCRKKCVRKIFCNQLFYDISIHFVFCCRSCRSCRNILWKIFCNQKNYKMVTKRLLTMKISSLISMS